MREFFIALQFLTRISVVKQKEWTAESFGRSVRYFPVVGTVLGLIYAAVIYGLDDLLPIFGGGIPQHFRAFLLLSVPILLTGGIHCDGFMDTMDGVFSGRSRQRMLEIMKDSRVGAIGVTAFVLLLMGNAALILDMPVKQALPAFFALPIIGRFVMTAAVILFPYARPEGMGKAFSQYAEPRDFWLAFLFTIGVLLFAGRLAWISFFAASVVSWILARYMVRKLGGLTGDTYGFLTCMAESVVLFVFVWGSSIG